MRRLLRLAMATAICIALPARAAPSCKGISVTPLSFGAYDVYSAAPLDSAGTITYSCPPPALPSVTIDLGLSFGNGHRRMALGFGSDFLQYDVYLDAARTAVWPSSNAIGVPQGNNQSIPIYGRVFPQQDVSVGTYTDTLVVTFNF
jgi:spore coat protein U domain-containing protein, fimbrial subunit CupE1/2/3/6